MVTVDFATFCHKGDVERLHAPGQLRKQVASNNYRFSKGIIIYQLVSPARWNYLISLTVPAEYMPLYSCHEIKDIDYELASFGIDINKPQYVSDTDQAHTWKNHVVNHIVAIQNTNANYIVFADADCWMVEQPEGKSSWIELGIDILEYDPNIFIVSPNDGEPERATRRMSQQMFMARVDEFRNANFNQPGWDGNVNIEGGPFPEYWALLEGRMELHCRQAKQYRYVLGPEYRYWHFNRLNEDGHFETDRTKY